MEKASEKKNVEFFETCMKLQEEFLDNWAKSQKEFLDNWFEATKKMQEAFLNLEGGNAFPPGKEIFQMYNTWFNTMSNSSKIFTDEAMKMQEMWKASMKKPMMSSDLFKNFTESFQQKFSH